MSYGLAQLKLRQNAITYRPVSKAGEAIGDISVLMLRKPSYGRSE